MPPATLEDVLAELTQAFPYPPVPAATLRVYLSKLSEVPVPTLARVVHELICTRERFPPLAVILEACAEVSLALPGEAAALAQVEAGASWARRPENERGAPPAVHPLVREAVEHVGGYFAFRSTDNPAVLRGQFARIYKELRAQAIREAATSEPAALNAGPRLRALPGGEA